jgi:serine/threonine protein kinase
MESPDQNGASTSDIACDDEVPGHDRDADSEAALLGETIAGNYRIEEVIGVGGMGSVYRARQLSLDRMVALKVLHPRCSRDPQYVARFRVEAMAASRLEHPHSVRILDFGQGRRPAAGTGTSTGSQNAPLLYLAMEYVRGRTLLDIIEASWPLGQRRIVDLLSQVLSALAVAHDLGIVHRDLKPENVLVCQEPGDDGYPVEVAKVCDFGIAKLIACTGSQPDGEPTATSMSAELGRITQTGTVIGTPDYFSPEQARAEPLDARSDLYSVGVVLYHALAGRLPFEAANPLAVSYMQVSLPPPPPSQFLSVPPALETICLKAMAKRPGDRFQSAREMRAALRAIPDDRLTRRNTLVAAAGRPTVKFTRSSWPPPVNTWSVSTRLKAALIAIAAAGALAAALAQPWKSDPPVPDTAQPAAAAVTGSLPAAQVMPTSVPPPSRPPTLAPGHSLTGTPTADIKNEGQRPRRRSWRHDSDGVLPPSFMLP